jgi:hypothetical protein
MTTPETTDTGSSSTQEAPNACCGGSSCSPQAPSAATEPTNPTH